MFGARFAVFVRRARVLPSPCHATRNLSFLEVSPAPSPCCFNSLCSGNPLTLVGSGKGSMLRRLKGAPGRGRGPQYGLPCSLALGKRAPVARTLQTVSQTCPCTTATCPYRFARFPSCGIFIPTRTYPSKNYELKQQGDGAGETSRTTNYELQGKGQATRAPVAQTLQTVRQTCSCTTATCLYLFARFPSCGIFTPTRTSPETTT